MNTQTRYVPPSVDFDPRLANELERWEADQLAQTYAADTPVFGEAWPDPFDGYTRSLTERGGFLFTYWDQAASPLLTALRFFTWPLATGMAAWLLYAHSPFNGWTCFILLIMCGALFLYIVVLRPIRVWHSIEIHRDGMIVNGRWFAADGFGSWWPQVIENPDDPARFAVSGIYGTRFVELATANRLDDSDRIAEVLREDLKEAMAQLWGRRDAITTAAL
jgi:hypothetical protein